MEQINQDTKLLPIAKVDGREFLVDIERREFRDFDDQDNVIKMRSSIGRQIISEMQGTQWNSMGISTGRQRESEV